MNTDREQRIRERAYHIWEQQGRPEGGHEGHWHQAERELGEEETGSVVPATPGEAAEASAEITKAKRRSPRSGKASASQPESGSTPAEAVATEHEVEPTDSKRRATRS